MERVKQNTTDFYHRLGSQAPPLGSAAKPKKIAPSARQVAQQIPPVQTRFISTSKPLGSYRIGLNHLPADLNKTVFSFLPASDLAATSQVCRDLKNALMSRQNPNAMPSGYLAQSHAAMTLALRQHIADKRSAILSSAMDNRDMGLALKALYQSVKNNLTAEILQHERTVILASNLNHRCQSWLLGELYFSAKACVSAEMVQQEVAEIATAKFSSYCSFPPILTLMTMDLDRRAAELLIRPVKRSWLSRFFSS